MKSLPSQQTEECLETCRQHWSDSTSWLLVASLNSDGLMSSARRLGHCEQPREEWDTPPEFGEIVLQPQDTGHLLPMARDEWLLKAMSKQGVGLYLVDVEKELFHPVLEPVRLGVKPQPLESNQIQEWFGNNGLLASELSKFEERPEQKELAWNVAEAMNHNRVLLAEAGTGTGKSLAYLVPSLLWALQNRERIVLSTGTIHLQEQLYTKEIPLLQRLLPRPFRAALVKGRQNYLCLRRFEEWEKKTARERAREQDEAAEALIEWVGFTRKGDRSEWEKPLPAALWRKVKVEAESCQRSQCPQYQKCFFYRSRRDLTEADLLVTNHHLLMADLSLRYPMGNYESTVLLPSYQRLVLDEAHHLEDVVSSFLGYSVGKHSILQTLGLARGEEAGLETLFFELADQLPSSLWNKSKSQNWIGEQKGIAAAIQKEWIPLVHQAGRKTEEATQKMQQILRSSSNQALPSKIWVNRNLIWQGPWNLLRRLGMKWAEYLEEVLGPMKETVQAMGRWGWLEHKQWKGWVMEFQAAQKHLEFTIKVMRSFFAPSMDDPEPEEQPLVRWFEGEGEWLGEMKMVAAPLEVAQAVQEMLCEPMKSVVMTSATMTTGFQDFSFLKNRLGLTWLSDSRFHEEQYPSPFDYESQSLLVIPNDLPEPNDEHYASKIVDPIFDSIVAAGGRSFVLCTSYALMYELHDRLKDRLEQAGYRVLCQGKGSRKWLLSQKKSDPTSVLFGTDSFWEGVDVPGDALRNVILTRLPFRMPTEPLWQARMKALEAMGQNSFQEYVVPMAVLRFKQGFGRLVRTQSDRGTVVLLDRRAITKEYGSLFLQALPQEVPILQESWRSILESLRLFHGDTVVSEPY